MRAAVLVGVFGALGADTRYWVEGFVSRRFPGAFPLGTFVINISGAFLLGLVFTVMTERFLVAPHLRSAVTIGFIGAYTTFSTLSFETFRLLEEGAFGLAAANSLGSLLLGLGAVYAGVIVGRVV